MKQNKLKLLRKLPMLLICLMMLPALAAMEEPEENIGSFFVPTPTPVVKEEPADSSGSFFVPTPSPEEPVPTETVLRDIGFILHMEGRLVWENIEIGGSTANAYQYRTKLTQNIVDEYLSECRSLGWTVSEEWLNDGLFAYRLSDSNSLALFLPIYDQGEPLLIVQDSVDFIRYFID